MKKILLKSMLLIAGLFGSITANAYDFEVNGIYYNKTSEATVEVSKNGDNSYSGSVVIPASVTNGVTSYSVTKIGYGAFLLCKGLTSVTIPNSVTEIGQIVFSYCTSLKEIIVDSENPSYSDLDGVLFNKDKTTLIAYPNAKSSTAYTIPNSVTSIGTSAFETCTGLTNVTIPNSVTEIGYGAFAGCTGLTNVTIPNSVTSIGEWAFASCTSLISVEIPNSVASIGNDAFHYCSSLTSIEIPNSVTELGRYAFMLCTSLTSATIGNSVTSIREWAFRDCTNLTSVTIGNSVTSIGQWAFRQCTNLTSITIPNSVTKIDRSAFYDCTDLKEYIVALENLNYSDLDGVLFNKDKTTLIAYPNAKNSTTYTIPNSVDSIGNSAFCDCHSLKSVEIPNSVTSIGGGAFDCSSLTSVTIPNSVTSIGEWAFRDCKSLTNATIGNSVTSIKAWVLGGCTSLKDVYNYSEEPQEIIESSFKHVDLSTCKLYVPAGCAEAYRAADVWKEFTIEELKWSFEVAGIYYKITSETDKTVEVVNGPMPYNGDVVIPTSVTHEEITYSVTKIDDYAFYECTGLTSITIPNSVTSIGWMAFFSCTSLKEFIVASDNLYYSDLDGVLFNKNKTTLIAYPNAKSPTTYTIPNSVTEIGGYAFGNCKGLTSVTIPNSVTNIDEEAFWGCASLTSIEIPNSVTEIEPGAFEHCTNLTSVTIPNSVTKIDRDVFFECTGLTSVTIPNSVTLIGQNALYGTGLTSVTIPNSVTEIRLNAFADCQYLTEIYNYSEEPQEIIAEVFKYVENLSTRTLYVPAGCADAYRAADVWKEFNIEEMENNIEIAGIYYNITSKADKTVAVTYRDNNYNSYSGDVVIPASVTIGGETYSVTEIGKDAFSYCDDLASVSIPNSITKIGEQTFSGCTSLVCVIIPKSVKEISPTAFSGCTGLEEIYNYSEEPQQVANVFANVNIPNCKLYVPTGYAQTYRTAEIWKDFDIQEFTPTGVEAVTGNEVNIAVVGNTITINGAAETAKVAVYGINGELVYSGVAKSITVPAHGVYIVRVAGVTKKVTF